MKTTSGIRAGIIILFLCGGALFSETTVSAIEGPAAEGQAENIEGEDEAAEGVNENPLGITFSQHMAVANYASGEAMDVTITITAATPGDLRALGLYQALPTGWVYNGMRVLSGELPLVAPEPGTAGPLEFAWITIPILPYSFVYSVTPPEDACAAVHIPGQIEYRTTGPAYFVDNAGLLINGPGCESAEVMYSIAWTLYRHFDLSDENKDGSLSFVEASGVLCHLTSDQFAELDTDQDALLSPYELTAYMDDHAPAYGCLGSNSVYLTLWETIKASLGDFILLILLIISFVIGYRFV